MVVALAPPREPGPDVAPGGPTPFDPPPGGAVTAVPWTDGVGAAVAGGAVGGAAVGGGAQPATEQNDEYGGD